MRRERAFVVAMAAVLAAGAVSADAASLATVRERGTFGVCAHPDALPYSSQDRTLPGFQLEIAEAIASQLGVRLRVEWIVFTRHARRVDCDATIGAIVKADTDGAPRRGPRLTGHTTSSTLASCPCPPSGAPSRSSTPSRRARCPRAWCPTPMSAGISSSTQAP